MDERHRRLWAGTEARALGRSGIAVVARATGLARNTIVRGLAELAQKRPLSADRVRRPGAGRKRMTFLVPGLTTALEDLVEPVTRGDPESPLRWTSKSTRHLARELNGQGFAVSHTLVAGLLHDLEYSLQANRKTLEGAGHPDRNAQFEHINEAVKRQLGPVKILVDHLASFAGKDAVVPVTVERVRFQADGVHLFPRRLESIGIHPGVQDTPHLETRRRPGGRDEADDGRMSEQGPAAPVL